MFGHYCSLVPRLSLTVRESPLRRHAGAHATLHALSVGAACSKLSITAHAVCLPGQVRRQVGSWSMAADDRDGAGQTGVT